MVAYCKRCGKTINWFLNENGRWEPLNIDGSSHFDTCPYAKDFKRKFSDKGNVDYTKLGRKKDQKRLDEF